MTKAEIMQAAESVLTPEIARDLASWHWLTQRALFEMGIAGTLTYDDFRSIVRPRNV